MVERGKVYLLGAGPGDPGLITLRASRYLREVDVVFYDALVHPSLLDHCREDAERVFVGKRAGQASERQARINASLIAAARAGKSVARLKGGDPYLFGRGSEEAETLAHEGIPFEVVPGVASPSAATAYAGISLTHRELASSVAYITATESVEKDRSSHEWHKLATATQTLVIFMGTRKLDTLMNLLVEHGRPPETPAAVIQSASLPTQRTVTGTVADIAERARAANIGMPALTVVGPVVALRDSLRWFDTKPLFGKRVLVTRPTHQASSLSEHLRDEAAAPIEAPTIRIVPPADPAPLAEAIARLDTYDWVVFTSANGVDAFFDVLRGRNEDARKLGRARLCAIGPKTAAALRAKGLNADVVPNEYKAEAAFDALRAAAGTLQGQRILLPRAAVAREVLPERLRSAGAVVDVVEAYRTVPPTDEDMQRLRGLFERHEVDVVTFTSSSTVENLVDALGQDAPHLLADCTVASIGPITTETARRLGVHVTVTATEYTIEGLVQSLRDHFTEK